MSNLPVTGVFNDGYIAELYESFRRDPSSVDESWHQIFRLAETLAGGVGRSDASDVDLQKKAAGAAELAQAIRIYGHLAVPIDPLGSEPLGAPELTPEFHEITEQDLEAVPAAALGFQNDARFGEMLVRSRIEGGYGPRWILAELKTHGIAEAKARALIDEAGPDWVALLRRLMRRRYGRPPASLAERTKRANFLLRRGFDVSTVKLALGNNVPRAATDDAD